MKELQKNTEQGKMNRTIGKWIIRIAVIVFGINVICRMVDAGKSKEYVQVQGTVTKVATENEGLVRAGNRMVQSYSYGVWVEYPLQGIDYPQTLYENHQISQNYSKGDVVTVLYHKYATYKAYIAKKDWMTGAYLPASKWYNVPFVIAIVLFIAGLLLYKNCLDWKDLAELFRAI